MRHCLTLFFSLKLTILTRDPEAGPGAARVRESAEAQRSCPTRGQPHGSGPAWRRIQWRPRYFSFPHRSRAPRHRSRVSSQCRFDSWCFVFYRSQKFDLEIFLEQKTFWSATIFSTYNCIYIVKFRKLRFSGFSVSRNLQCKCSYKRKMFSPTKIFFALKCF